MVGLRRTPSRRWTALLAVVAVLCASDARLTLGAGDPSATRTAEGLTPRCLDEGGDCCSPGEGEAPAAPCGCCTRVPDVPRDSGDSRPLSQPPVVKVGVDLGGVAASFLFDLPLATSFATLPVALPATPPPLVLLSNHLRC